MSARIAYRLVVRPRHSGETKACIYPARTSTEPIGLLFTVWNRLWLPGPGRTCRWNLAGVWSHGALTSSRTDTDLFFLPPVQRPFIAQWRYLLQSSCWMLVVVYVTLFWLEGYREVSTLRWLHSFTSSLIYPCKPTCEPKAKSFQVEYAVFLYISISQFAIPPEIFSASEILIAYSPECQSSLCIDYIMCEIITAQERRHVTRHCNKLAYF